jgi:hypothetical protein
LNSVIKAGKSKPVERDGDAAARLWFWVRHFDDYGGLPPPA